MVSISAVVDVLGSGSEEEGETLLGKPESVDVSEDNEEEEVAKGLEEAGEAEKGKEDVVCDDDDDDGVRVVREMDEVSELDAEEVDGTAEDEKEVLVVGVSGIGVSKVKDERLGKIKRGTYEFKVVEVERIDESEKREGLTIVIPREKVEVEVKVGPVVVEVDGVGKTSSWVIKTTKLEASGFLDVAIEGKPSGDDDANKGVTVGSDATDDTGAESVEVSDRDADEPEANYWSIKIARAAHSTLNNKPDDSTEELLLFFATTDAEADGALLGETMKLIRTPRNGRSNAKNLQRRD
ncbi:hypothetical protein AX15_005484 [Amanita polypyramis BW_CC]|nr:hypothetical protein AX15_005484 [Amanita polypyramis BW_CC]